MVGRLKGLGVECCSVGGNIGKVVPFIVGDDLQKIKKELLSLHDQASAGGESVGLHHVVVDTTGEVSHGEIRGIGAGVEIIRYDIHHLHTQFVVQGDGDECVVGDGEFDASLLTCWVRCVLGQGVTFHERVVDIDDTRCATTVVHDLVVAPVIATAVVCFAYRAGADIGVL